MPFYIPDVPDKKSCIGNTLSSIQISLTALDTNLKTISSQVSFVSSSLVTTSATLTSHVNFLSSSMISTSANIMTHVNYVSSQLNSASATLALEIDAVQTHVNYVSANVIADYVRQGTINQGSDGSINWDALTQGHNAKVILLRNGNLNNPTGMSAGDTANLVLQIGGTAGVSVTAFGNNYLFGNGISALTTTASAYNLMSLYYDGSKFLSNIVSFS